MQGALGGGLCDSEDGPPKVAQRGSPRTVVTAMGLGPGQKAMSPDALGSVWGRAGSSFSFQACLTEGEIRGSFSLPERRVMMGSERWGWGDHVEYDGGAVAEEFPSCLC